MFKEIRMPDIGLDKVEVTEIMVKKGDYINKEQSILTVEGDKSSIEVPSPIAGIVDQVLVKIGDKISTSKKIIILKNDEDIKNADDILNDDFNKNKFFKLNNKKIENNQVHASPFIRRLSRKLNIDLNTIQGTGNKNRILKEDIESYINKNKKNINNDKNIINFEKFGKIEKLKFSNIQKIISINLSNNWKNIPHVSIYETADITNLEQFRKHQNKEFIKNKIEKKINLLLFIIKAVSKALIEFPIFNSSIAENNEEIILKKYINISIAISTKYGLFVPVIYDVNKKNILELLKDFNDIYNKAHKNELTNKEMQGGCFTISNLGGIGSKWFNPIINAPEVAILGISKACIEAVWLNNQFHPRLILPLSLSFDHRVINGSEAAKFIKYITDIMTDIRKLII